MESGEVCAKDRSPETVWISWRKPTPIQTISRTCRAQINSADPDKGREKLLQNLNQRGTHIGPRKTAAHQPPAESRHHPGHDNCDQRRNNLGRA
jgi:hypothetical protein